MRASKPPIRTARVRIRQLHCRLRRLTTGSMRRIHDPELPVHLLVADMRIDADAMEEVLAYWHIKLERVEALKARLSTPHAVLEITR